MKINNYNFYIYNSLFSIFICKKFFGFFKMNIFLVCGKKRAEATTLVIDGQNVTKGDFPWQVALYRKKDNQLICGGSLISQFLIISGK